MNYHKKLSGPLLDRIDVPAVKIEELTDEHIGSGETSQIVQKRVQKARDIQTERFKRTTITANAEMSNKDTLTYCPLDNEAKAVMKLAV